MNILTGIHKADAGKIFVDGQEVHFKNARDAENHGIAFIHQELNIWPNLSILGNLVFNEADYQLLRHTRH